MCISSINLFLLHVGELLLFIYKSGFYRREKKNSHQKITITHTQTTYINRIALRAGKKVARPAEIIALASVFEKSATELKQQKLLKCKQTIQIGLLSQKLSKLDEPDMQDTAGEAGTSS